MAPARPLKRQKTDPDTPSSSEVRASQIPLPPETSTLDPTDQPASSKKEERRASWYSKSWQQKAAPITQIARESISTDGIPKLGSIFPNAGEGKEKIRNASSPSLAKTLGRDGSNRSRPASAETSRIHATPQGSISSQTKPSPADASDPKLEAQQTEVPKQNIQKNTENVKPKSASSSSTPLEDIAVLGNSEDTLRNRSSWLDWLSKKEEAAKSLQKEQISSSQPPQPVNQKVELPTTESKAKESSQVDQIKPTDAPTNPNNKRSWLQMWNNDLPAISESVRNSIDSTLSPKQLIKSKNPEIIVDIDKKGKSESSAEPPIALLETSPPPELPGDSSKSSGWVFWSRDKKADNSTSTEADAHVGHIAISDTPSQTKPKRASISIKDENARPDLNIAKQLEPKANTTATAEPLKQGKSEQPATPKKDTAVDPKTVIEKKGDAKGVAMLPQEAENIQSSRTASPAPLKKGKNLLLPRIKDTIGLQDNPSLLQQFARLLYYNKEPESKHLYLTRNPPKIKNALAIGVHGFFPATVVRTVIGQPTGTSIKFADMAAESIKNWTKGQGYECEVKTAALEGEGKIGERIEVLWRLLLNFIDEIRKSDFVLIAAHSQGVPVAIMLVAKLIQFGCLNTARVGICAMAGVNLGPFPGLKSRWISGSAGELFEFSDPSSKVSSDYRASLQVVLQFGVRISFIGSIDDQLVSLESSVFSSIIHPHLYRAVLIDSRVHAPNFLSHLVGFALKLRNLGIQDHGLIRELSSPLAGSLYTGEGHSRIYDDAAVYDLAIAFALETTSLPNIPMSESSGLVGGSGNPYILPFAMRGILEEDFVKTHLQGEASELLKQFDDWKPTTKVLKDVKFRLEGIRSKL